MAKLTKEQIADRRKRMQEEARKSINKSEQLNLRIDEESLSRLYAFAAKCGKPVGTLVREWTIERLDAEEKGESGRELASILDSLNSLHSKVDKLESIQQK